MTAENLDEMTKEELIRELRKLRATETELAAMVGETDPTRIIHELQVHQVELEMQNRELCETQGLLEESRSRYADLFDFAPVGYCTLDLEGCLTEINQSGATLLGVRRDEVLGKPFSAVAAVKSRHVFRAHMKACAERKERVTTEITLSSARRGPCVVQMVSVPIPGDSGIPIAYRTALIDISQLKDLEDKLRFLARAGETLSTSLDYQTTLSAVAHLAVPLLADICIVDVLDESGEAQRLEVVFADATKQRELGEQIRSFVPQKGWQTPQAKVIATGEPILLSDISDRLRAELASNKTHADIMHAAGHRSMIVTSLRARGRTLGALTLVSAESGRRYSQTDLAFAQDIARRAAMAMDNAQLHAAAQRAIDDRDTVLALVSHDLRNLLGIILLKTALMLKAPTSVDRRIHTRKSLESIHRAGKRMNRMIQDLLDHASIEAGRLSIERKRQSARTLMLDALEMHDALALAKFQVLRCEFSGGDDFYIECDRDRVLQVFANLIGNAIKFSPERSEITVHAEIRDSEVCFSVSDQGPGISQLDLPHIFDRFWQAKKTARLGTGLGLSIAKGIVDAHGGQIWAESRLSRGSVFFFTLPFAPAREVRESGVRLAQANASAGTIDTPRVVLVVDDDADFREALRQALEPEGFDVVGCENGAEALDYLHRSTLPSVIVLDLTMPVMDGWMFLAARNRDSELKTVPVIVMSSQQDVGMQVAAADAGYVPKPVRLDRLVEALRRTVG